MKYSSVPSTKVNRAIINTSETERHKDDIAHGIGARKRKLTRDKTGGIIFFGLNQTKKNTEKSDGMKVSSVLLKEII